MAKWGTNKTPSNSDMSIPQDQLTDMIRKKAYEFYEKRGKKQGRDLDYWLQAEKVVKSKTATKW